MPAIAAAEKMSPGIFPTAARSHTKAARSLPHRHLPQKNTDRAPRTWTEIFSNERDGERIKSARKFSPAGADKKEF